MATTRIVKEVTDLKALPSTLYILERSPVDDPSSNAIVGRILPQSEVFNQAAFRLEIQLSADYPFKAPDVRFLTRIYHPNVETETGKICLEILNGTNYRATVRLAEVVKAVVALIDTPNLDHALMPGKTIR